MALADKDADFTRIAMRQWCLDLADQRLRLLTPRIEHPTFAQIKQRAAVYYAFVLAEGSRYVRARQYCLMKARTMLKEQAEFGTPSSTDEPTDAAIANLAETIFAEIATEPRP